LTLEYLSKLNEPQRSRNMSLQDYYCIIKDGTNKKYIKKINIWL